MPSIPITEKLASGLNGFLAQEFIMPLDEAVKKYAGAAEAVKEKNAFASDYETKYSRPSTIETGNIMDGEINYTLYSRSYDIQGSYQAGTIGIVKIFGWRCLNENSNASTIYGSRAKIHFPFDVPGMGGKREDVNIDDQLRTKLAIAALFGTWEVEPKYLTEHAQEIDDLRGQIFENWQSGVSSIDEYFVKE